MVFALALPIVSVIAIGAVELARLASDRALMQAAADSAALAGAKELSVSSAQSVIERSKASVFEQLGGALSTYKTVVADGTVNADPATLTVAITAHRLSFFGNLLPPGGFTIKVTSTAAPMNSAPLCVLAHGIVPPLVSLGKVKLKAGLDGPGILIQDNAKVEAPACLVQSNDDLSVTSKGRLYAAVARAGGIVRGAVVPSGESSAPIIEDPFAEYDLTIPTSCPKDSAPTVKISGAGTLPAGVHCGGMELNESAILTLGAGEHYFIGDVKVTGDAQLTGSDAVLIFDKDSKFEFRNNSRVSLEGRKTGRLAGFVVITTRDNVRDFNIDSGRVESLLGTIYIPQAQLVIEGTQRVAESSDWTVIIAKQVMLKGSPSLIINANYATSNVPVPQGVGPSTGVQLLK